LNFSLAFSPAQVGEREWRRFVGAGRGVGNLLLAVSPLRSLSFSRSVSPSSPLSVGPPPLQISLPHSPICAGHMEETKIVVARMDASSENDVASPTPYNYFFLIDLFF
jgi:hypothetical protein